MRKHSRIILLSVTMAVMAALLAWSFHGKDYDKVLDSFRTVRWWLLPPAIIVGLLVYPIKAWRWRLILGQGPRPGFRALYSAIMIGFMVNCIFSRIGEIVRAAVLGAKGEMATSRALASIAVERVFDLIIVVLFLVVALLTIPAHATGEGAEKLATLRTVGAFAAAAFVAGAAFLVLLRFIPEATIRLCLHTVAWLPDRLRRHVEHFLRSFLTGLNTLKSLRQVAVILLLSLLHWSMQALYFLLIGFCFTSFDLTVPGAMLVFAVSSLGVGAMPTPGYLGVYQGTIEAAGLILALSPDITFGYAWLAWAANIPAVILVGLVCLWIEGLSLGKLGREAATAHRS